jgi:hypothetical protein
MKPLNEVVRRIIELREEGIQLTLLAVCPNSAAVLEAAVKDSENNMPMLLRVPGGPRGGYRLDGPRRSWSNSGFARKYNWDSPVLPGSGPWLEGLHALRGLA